LKVEDDGVRPGARGRFDHRHAPHGEPGDTQAIASIDAVTELAAGGIEHGAYSTVV
jgi:hypothetical protein